MRDDCFADKAASHRNARRVIVDPRGGDQTCIPQSFMAAKYIFHMNGLLG